MEINETLENIELIFGEPKNPIDKAKFIICHVYYFIRTFYTEKLLDRFSNDFQKYLNSFKNKYQQQDIQNKFSFDLLNRSYSHKSQINTAQNKTGENIIIPDKINSNEEIYYDLLYRKLINIILKYKFSIEEKDLIYSYISLRNCLIFLEYLYLFINKYPNKISHYIIKIDISLLLDIPQKHQKD